MFIIIRVLGFIRLRVCVVLRVIIFFNFVIGCCLDMIVLLMNLCGGRSFFLFILVNCMIECCEFLDFDVLVIFVLILGEFIILYFDLVNFVKLVSRCLVG